MTFLSDASLTELALIVILAAFSAVTGGVAGYGTGALMPLILVPMVGAAPVVPIIAISALFTNSARVLAFRRLLDPRRALIALVCALPTCVLGAYLYTLLTGRGAALVIGSSLIATVPLRRLLKRRGHRLGEKGYAAAAAGWGIVVGGTTGAGVILLSLLMATGLEGAAVIATDAAVSIGMGIVKISVFGSSRRAHPDGDRDCAVDQRRRLSMHVSRQAHHYPHAGSRAYRLAGRRGHHRRLGDDFWRLAIGRRAASFGRFHDRPILRSGEQV